MILQYVLISNQQILFVLVLRLIFHILLLMQHIVAFLLHKQQNRLTLIIEQVTNAWYYVITARETKNKKEENTMLTSLACFGIYATVTVGTIWFFSKL